MASGVIHLTDKERSKFVAWLLQDAEATKGIILGFQRLGHHAATSKMKSELAAFLIVAAKLDAMEEQVIHGNS